MGPWLLKIILIFPEYFVSLSDLFSYWSFLKSSPGRNLTQPVSQTTQLILPLIRSQLHLLPPQPICINCFRNPFPLCSSSSSYAHCVIFCKELKHLEFDKLPWKLHFALFRMKCYRAKFEVRSKRGRLSIQSALSRSLFDNRIDFWPFTAHFVFCITSVFDKQIDFSRFKAYFWDLPLLVENGDDKVKSLSVSLKQCL